jgi:hypothetical protein
MASFIPRAAPQALRVTARAAARPQLRFQRPIAPLFRARGLATTAEQPRLRLGSVGKHSGPDPCSPFSCSTADRTNYS